jgi:hypothetical protein
VSSAFRRSRTTSGCYVFAINFSLDAGSRGQVAVGV